MVVYRLKADTKTLVMATQLDVTKKVKFCRSIGEIGNATTDIPLYADATYVGLNGDANMQMKPASGDPVVMVDTDWFVLPKVGDRSVVSDVDFAATYEIAVLTTGWENSAAQINDEP